MIDIEGTISNQYSFSLIYLGDSLIYISLQSMQTVR